MKNLQNQAAKIMGAKVTHRVHKSVKETQADLRDVLTEHINRNKK